MDYKFGYLFLGVLLFLIWLSFYFIRKDLRRKQLKVSWFGGLAGLIAEYWYFKDYWHPYSILGRKIVSPEDFIFGFTITGISVVVYDIFFKTKDEQYVTNNKKTFGNMFILGVASLFLFNIFFGYNSIFVSSITFVILSLFMLSKRADLLKEAFFSGLIVLIIMFVVYHILFNLMFLDFWDKCWLLTNTRYGIEIYGNIPLTEMIWYFTWGSFSGIAYNFASGKKKIPLSN